MDFKNILSIDLIFGPKNVPKGDISIPIFTHNTSTINDCLKTSFVRQCIGRKLCFSPHNYINKTFLTKKNLVFSLLLSFFSDRYRWILYLGNTSPSLLPLLPKKPERLHQVCGGWLDQLYF